jgi:O-antigen/teichoic acid export membrane protein
MSGDRLAGRTAAAVAWMAFGILGQRSVSLISTIVLARLLTPAAYGLFGMGMVVIAAAHSLRDLGTSSALIQRKDVSRSFASTVFWINVVFGLAGALVLAAVAAPAAAMYREPQVIPVLAVLSLSFLMGNVGAVPQAMLMRALAFRQIALIQVTSALLSTALAIGLAASGGGVWSLVGALVTESLISAALFWWAAAWRPEWHFSYGEVRDVTGYSLNLAGSRVLLYAIANVDKALVGRYLGAVALGYYALAHGLMMYPLHNIAWALTHVMFPALSRLQDDPERLARAYVRAVGVIAALCFPLMLGMCVMADVLVLACFGPTWLPMVPLLRILALAGMVQSTSTTAGMVTASTGQTQWLLRLVCGEAAFALIGYTVALRWGTIGVATACATVHVMWSIPRFACAARLLGIPAARVYRSLWAPLRDASLMAVLLLLARVVLVSSGISTPGVLLVALVPAGVLAYAALALRSRAPYLRDVVQLIPPTRFAWMRKLTAVSRG